MKELQKPIVKVVEIDLQDVIVASDNNVGASIQTVTEAQSGNDGLMDELWK